ncbi:photosynthetic protein synthase I [Acidobacteria bacterium AH-259-D05]|nr:photosynthetic protein synthase I [Acidobacteria bacterium AH-259-D05]
MNVTTKTFLAVVGAALLTYSFAVLQGAVNAAAGPSPDAALTPLPALAQKPDPEQVALGKLLFFDPRLSGDSTVSCSSCHDPSKGWTDGLPLSKGYPGSLYFRNTPTVLNAVHGGYLYWDGRLPASDLPTLVRDHISEAHFMQADGRLVIEQLRQVPTYENGFKKAFGGEPTYGRILNAVTAFLQTLSSHDVPFDRYLRGETGAISDAARRGLELFEGKAGCSRCHSGPMLSDGSFHNLGMTPNREIFRTPERHITFRRFFKTLGVPEYAELRADVGLYAVTKRPEDRGQFRTPTLREVSKTAPYMHDGSLAALEEVVEFYNRGGGVGSGKDPLLAPLGLTDSDKNDLVEFLKTLAGTAISMTPPKIPEYELRTLGENQ